MQLQALVTTSQQVAGTRSRLAKRASLAQLLRRADAADIEILVAYLAGELRQRRTGIGWSSLRSLPPPAVEPGWTLTEVDARLQAISELSGPGSAGQRADALAALFAGATADEQDFLRRLIGGEIRQGALDSSMLDALAEASGRPLPTIRRAVMLRGATGPVALAALTGDADALARFDLSVQTPVRPMLASSAPDVAAALDKLGPGTPVGIDVKLDGIRIQAHKSTAADGVVVRLFTRSLDDATVRLPEVVEQVRALPVRTAILDGEVLAVDPSGRPRPFQETASRAATHGEVASVVTAFFFDALLIDDDILIDEPLTERLRRLDQIVAPQLRLARTVTADPGAAQEFFAAALTTGQEGVVVKALDAPYEAGRRGAGWIKVKPRLTLDLVVLGVEWGSGRRHGLLSNIHLGARDPATDGWVMLGKTFKGMTDEMLAWQTERFLALETSRSGHVVWVRPEQVVEIAFDGLQRSTRYPGGLALRFARVLRYREDKRPDEADTIDAVRALHAG